MSQWYEVSWPRPIAVSACSGSTVEMSYHGDSSIPHRAAALSRLPSDPKHPLCVSIALNDQNHVIKSLFMRYKKEVVVGQGDWTILKI